MCTTRPDTGSSDVSGHPSRPRPMSPRPASGAAISRLGLPQPTSDSAGEHLPPCPTVCPIRASVTLPNSSPRPSFELESPRTAVAQTDSPLTPGLAQTRTVNLRWRSQLDRGSCRSSRRPLSWAENSHLSHKSRLASSPGFQLKFGAPRRNQSRAVGEALE